jgi:hypothetical protein
MADRVPTSFGKFVGNALTGGQAGRAHFSTAEVEAERLGAAQRLAALIERRELLVTRIGEIEFEMTACEKTIRSFD